MLSRGEAGRLAQEGEWVASRGLSARIANVRYWRLADN
jgi:hypothetical protein